MKIKKILLLIFTFSLFLTLASCGNKDIYAGYTKINLMLEGGTCQLGENQVTLMVNMGDIEEMLIPDPNVMIALDEEDDVIKRPDYHIEGWYRTKTVDNDGNVIYSEPWNFATDKITKAGVTLYAKWKKDVYHSYDFYYKVNGEEKLIEKVECTAENQKVSDLRTLDLINIDGYTPYAFVDGNGNPWDDSFTHPGGDEDCSIKVYVDVIPGEFELVSSASQLNQAISSKLNVYLIDDIDCEGYEFDFASYSGIIEGNGHKISNFKIDYSYSNGLKKYLSSTDPENNDHKRSRYLYISLFDELDGATIKNLTFENASVDIDIPSDYKNVYGISVVLLAPTITDSTITNVNMSGSVTITSLPILKEDTSNVMIFNDKLYVINDNSEITNSSCQLIG